MIFRSESEATGLQIAFLVLAVLLLAAPLDKYVLSAWPWSQQLDLPTGRIANFILACALLVCVPALRRRSRDLLSRPIPATRWKEVPAALAVDFVCAFGAFGAFALWHWTIGGEPALARRMGEESSHAVQWARAVSAGGIVHLALAALVAPVVEELVFRGFLYPAWERQWGWIAGAIATSAVFGLVHGAFLPQFLASIVFICALRRAGSLWAPILVHACFNTLLWYPLLGQFMLPSGRSTGELHLWWLQLACLAATFFVLPLYMWTSRDAKLPRTG